MTQPLAPNQTFDTSLIDVQRSFSSTETNTSGSSAKEDTKPPDDSSNASPSRLLPTDELYDRWASTYDTDGNVLQAVDDIHMRGNIPGLVELTSWSPLNTRETELLDTPVKILDFGCGTGRNTLKLLQAPCLRPLDVVGWDSSQAMLRIAWDKCDAATRSQNAPRSLEFQRIDFATPANVPEQYLGTFDGLISTLVLEHISASIFFSIIAKLLKPGAYALISNMHPDMGAVSRAGFKTASGERVKGVSYVYTVQDTIEAAEAAGLKLVNDVLEAAVEENMFDGVVDGKGAIVERARKWIGTKIWYSMLLRKQ